MDTPDDVIGRAVSLLRALSSAGPTGAGTSELARRSNLPRSTAHRLLTYLQHHGLADRDDRDGAWLLGPELYLLGAAAAVRFDVADLAQPVVRSLALETGESAFFSARRGDETVCLLAEEGSFPLRSHVLHEGVRFPLGVASAGLALLAHLPTEEAENYLEEARLEQDWGPAHAVDVVRHRLEQTRLQGFAVNPGLIVEGSWGMGAAVFDRAGEARWALSLTGVEHRFRADRQAQLGDLLLRAAHQLTRRIAKA